ncbi:MAG: hypothetical protein IPK52_09655 [Chloroflexi bacterium]|nr:hypothetical protein [Chloroflexota bacterium]
MTELPPPADPVPQPEQPPQFVPVILPPPAAPPPTGLKNPQILAAVITGFISLLVAIVGIIPSLIDKDKDEDPTPTYTAVVALIVSFTPSEVPTLAPTELPTLPLATQPTQLPPTDIQASIPTIVDVGTTPLPVIGSTPATAQPTSAQAPRPNIRLFFDSASLTVYNLRGGTKSLAGVSFISDEVRWESSQWGPIHEDLSNQDCLRLRDFNTSVQTPPAECQILQSLQLVGPCRHLLA